MVERQIVAERNSIVISQFAFIIENSQIALIEKFE